MRERDQAVVEARCKRPVPRLFVRKVERGKEPAPAHVRDDSGKLVGQLAQPSGESAVVEAGFGEDG